MRNLVATWASGEEFCRSPGFRAYVNSLSAVAEADKMVFTTDMPTEIRAKIHGRGVEVFDADPTDIHFLVRDRFYAFWKFLVERQKVYRYCVFTDCRDVVFQRDPFFFLRNDLPGYVILCGEGMRHSQSQWNSADQSEAQRNVREFGKEFGDRPVINAGVVLGTAPELTDLFLLLWTNTVRATGGGTEQGVLNYLYNFLENDPRYILAEPQHRPICVTGEAIRQGCFEPAFRDGLFCHPSNGAPYYIVHQYDRTAHAESVLARYSI